MSPFLVRQPSQPLRLLTSHRSGGREHSRGHLLGLDAALRGLRARVRSVALEALVRPLRQGSLQRQLLPVAEDLQLHRVTRLELRPVRRRRDLHRR